LESSHRQACPLADLGSSGLSELFKRISLTRFAMNLEAHPAPQRPVAYQQEIR
jgi:hypothetical protein